MGFDKNKFPGKIQKKLKEEKEKLAPAHLHNQQEYDSFLEAHYEFFQYILEKNILTQSQLTNVLDIGSFQGSAMDAISLSGATNVQGCDPDYNTPSAYFKRTITQKDGTSFLKDTQEKFSLITFLDIEHVENFGYDISSLINQARKHLEENGVILFTSGWNKEGIITDSFFESFKAEIDYYGENIYISKKKEF